MSPTRLSLWYVVAYLAVAGLALLLVPNFALTLVLSNNASPYGDIFPRFVGTTLIGIDILGFQIVRLHIEQLYSTTLMVLLLGGAHCPVRDEQRPVLPGRIRDRRRRGPVDGVQVRRRAPPSGRRQPLAGEFLQPTS
jgi:hypothetical protein